MRALYKISVIIPVYNAALYIENCIKSIESQTLKDLEIIIINDGSIDNTKEIIEEIRKKSSRDIVVINQGNKGPGAARNVGTNVASGEYLAFIDVDDKVKYNMYESLYMSAKKNCSDVVICGYEIISNEKKSKEILPNFKNEYYSGKEEIRENILKNIINNGAGIFASQCNKIYKREFIKKYNIKVNEKRRFGEDWFFNQLVLENATSISFVNEALYEYFRINERSLSSVYLQNSYELFKESYKFRRERMKNWKLNDEANIRIYNTEFCETIYTRILMNEFDNQNKININKKIKNLKKYLNDKEFINIIENSNTTRYTCILKNKKKQWIILNVFFDKVIRLKLSTIKRIILNKGEYFETKKINN